MEDVWNRVVYGHAGPTLIGAGTFVCEARLGGMQVNGGYFLVGTVDRGTGDAIDEHE